MTAESEQQLENDFIKQLSKNGYERVMIPDVDALMRNFRNQMNRLNAGNLATNDLTDTEFQRNLQTIEGKSVFESAEILRDKFVLERDDNSKIHDFGYKFKSKPTMD